MPENVLTTIVGFLSGSLVALVLKEALNQFNKRLDYRRDLNKVLYQRKLDVAERAVAYYWTLQSKILELKKCLQIVIAFLDSQTEKIDTSPISSAVVQISKVLEDLNGEKYFDINAVHLYFELEDSKTWNESNIEEMYKYAVEIQFYVTELADLNEKLNKYIDMDIQADVEHFSSKIKDTLPDYINLLKNFVDAIERNRTAIYSMIHGIKKQLRPR